MADHSFRYIETDIPEGMTLAEWRRRRRADRPRRHGLRRLLRRGR